ncbi:MAG: hypothetical protein GY786_04740 [Proteobacteria bacterium]|nr:hypothetical protein [Pseudomonadota bacterium]
MPFINSRKTRGIKIASIGAIIFGLLTIISGGSVLFAGDTIQNLAGNYIGFVVWYNFVAGFFYVLAGMGMWIGSRWTFWIPVLIVAAALVVALFLGLHIFNGGSYEMRTVIALSFRTAVWVFLARFTYLNTPRQVIVST